MLNKKQVMIIKYFISDVDYVNEKAKKIILWLIDKSENFSKNVALSSNHEGLYKDVMFGVHDLCSWIGAPKLNLILAIANEKIRFQAHSGRFISGKFDTKAGGGTIWIADEPYSRKCKIFELNPEEIDQISLVTANDLAHY